MKHMFELCFVLPSLCHAYNFADIEIVVTMKLFPLRLSALAFALFATFLVLSSSHNGQGLESESQPQRATCRQLHLLKCVSMLVDRIPATGITGNDLLLFKGSPKVVL